MEEELTENKLLRDCTVGDVKDLLNKSTEDLLNELEVYDYLDFDGTLCRLSDDDLKFMKDHETFHNTCSLLLSKPLYVGKDEQGDWLVMLKREG